MGNRLLPSPPPLVPKICPRDLVTERLDAQGARCLSAGAAGLAGQPRDSEGGLLLAPLPPGALPGPLVRRHDPVEHAPLGVEGAPGPDARVAELACVSSTEALLDGLQQAVALGERLPDEAIEACVLRLCKLLGVQVGPHAPPQASSHPLGCYSLLVSPA